jgi:hypothetical protein
MVMLSKNAVELALDIHSAEEDLRHEVLSDHWLGAGLRLSRSRAGGTPTVEPPTRRRPLTAASSCVVVWAVGD